MLVLSPEKTLYFVKHQHVQVHHAALDLIASDILKGEMIALVKL